MDKLQTMIHDLAKEIKGAEKAIRADELKSMGPIDDLCEMNAKKVYFETLLRKLQKIPGK